MQGRAVVVTLLNKNFSHTLISHAHDDEGRESVLLISREGRTTALCNIYGPNGDNATFYQNLGVKIRSLVVDAVILGGDLNSVMSPLEDRRSGTTPGSAPPLRTSDTVLPTFLALTGLRDTWRDLHPEGRDFTHFSHAHHSWSRLDYILMSAHLSLRVLSINIGPLVISDHAPVILHLAERGIYHFPTLLLSPKQEKIASKQIGSLVGQPG